MDRDLLRGNIVSTVKTAKAFDMPIVHSTINVATGPGKPNVPELAELLEDNPPIDRTTTNQRPSAASEAVDTLGEAPQAMTTGPAR